MNKRVKTQLEKLGLCVDDNRSRPSVSTVEPMYITVIVNKEDSLSTIIGKLVHESFHEGFNKGRDTGIKLFKDNFKDMFDIK